MVDPAVPRSWGRLHTWRALEDKISSSGGLIVIYDTAPEARRSGWTYHHPECPYVDETYFETKRANRWKNGAYYWIQDVGAAADGGAARCDHELDPINRS